MGILSLSGLRESLLGGNGITTGLRTQALWGMATTLQPAVLIRTVPFHSWRETAWPQNSVGGREDLCEGVVIVMLLFHDAIHGNCLCYMLYCMILSHAQWLWCLHCEFCHGETEMFCPNEMGETGRNNNGHILQPPLPKSSATDSSSAHRHIHPTL